MSDLSLDPPTEITPALPIGPPPYSVGVGSGVARAIILNPLYFWFRAPLKLFRPIRVDYLEVAKALAPPSAFIKKPGKIINFRATSIGLLHNAVKLEGFNFIPKYVLPPLIANSMVGIVLFTSYDLFKYRFTNLKDDNSNFSKFVNSSHFTPYFLAGGFAGACQSLVATPFDSIRVRTEVQELIEGKHRSIARFYTHTFKEIGLIGAYRGLAINTFKDFLGFGLFFGVFEFVNNQLRPLKASIIKSPQDSTYSDAMKEAGRVLIAGAASAITFQLVDYPLERVRMVVLARAAEMELKRPYVVELYKSSFNQIKNIVKSEGAIKYFYSGLSNSLWKAVPATSLGLLSYELIKQWFDHS